MDGWQPGAMRRLITPAIALAVLTGAGASEALGATTTRSSGPATALLRGVFTDSAKYTGTGSVAVTRRAGVRTVRLGRDFRADPESIRLRLYLATSASGRSHVDLGPMRETGAQRFRIPRAVNLSRYRYVIAWCAAVDEPITHARLLEVRR
jgi:hypothetical protein